MRWLVVYDGTIEQLAIQNLEVALQQATNLLTLPPAQHEEAGSPVRVQLEVAVLQLLQEEFPLDEYLGEMERAADHDLTRIEQLLQNQQSASHQIEVMVKLLTGQEKEASYLIAREAQKFGAARIYLPLDTKCWKCQNSKRPPRFNFNFLKSLFNYISNYRQPVKAFPQVQALDTSPVAYQESAVQVANLLALTACPVYPTCHGEVIFSLQMQHHSLSIEGNKQSGKYRNSDRD